MSAAPMSCRAGTTLVATICTDGCSLGIKRLRTQSTGTGRSSVACSCGAFAQWKGFHGNAALRAPATATAGRFRHGSERVGHFRTPLHWETLEHPVFPYQLGTEAPRVAQPDRVAQDFFICIPFSFTSRVPFILSSLLSKFKAGSLSGTS